MPGANPDDFQSPEKLVSPLPQENVDIEPWGADPDPPSLKDGDDKPEEDEGVSGKDMEAEPSRTVTVRATGGQSVSHIARFCGRRLEQLVSFSVLFCLVSLLSALLSFWSVLSMDSCHGCFCRGWEENFSGIPNGTPISTGDLANFGHQLVAEVKRRAVRSIETGVLNF